MGQEKQVMAAGSGFQGTPRSRHDAASITRPTSSQQVSSGSSRLPSHFTMQQAHDSSPYGDRPALARYGMGLFAVGVATAARLALATVVEGQFPFLTFFFALVFAAWFGGLGPSLLALAISLVTVPPLLDQQGMFSIRGLAAQLGFGLYVVTGLAICLMGGSMRLAQLRAEASEAAARRKQLRLEEEVAERKRAEDEKDRLLLEQQRLRAEAEEQSAVLANLLEQAPVGITFFDSDLRIFRINPH